MIFVEDLYWKQFGREEPELVRSIEDLVAARKKKKEEKRARKEAASLTPLDDSPLEESPF